MKVIQRGIMKIVPGKMAEATELMGKYVAILSRLLAVPAEKLPMKIYYPFIGGGDAVNTIVFEMEWDSFGEMAAFFERSMADADIQASMPKWQAVEQSHEVELYMAAPMP